MYSTEIQNLVSQKRNEGRTYDQIASDIGIPKSAVQSILSRRVNRKKRKVGPKPKIDKTQSLRIKRAIAAINENGEKLNSSKIIDRCDLNVSCSTVQRYMRSKAYVYKCPDICINLSKKHKIERMMLATKFLTSDIDWSQVVFSDEKRFSIDGPDNWMSYVHRKDKDCRYKHQMRGGSKMYWGMIFSDGSLYLNKIDGNMKSKDYVNMLSTFAVPIIKSKLNENFILQHDNCSVHKSKETDLYIKSQNINVLPWPACSPDLNIIENVWKMIEDTTYDGHQPNNFAELHLRIIEAVELINKDKKEAIINLYASIKTRLCEVLKNQGGSTKY